MNCKNEFSTEGRRNFFKQITGGMFGLSTGLGLTSIAKAQGKRAEKAKLTISRIEKFKVIVPENPGIVCDPKFESHWAPVWKGPKCILKLYGDNGYVGLGETDRYYNEEALEKTIQYLTGKDVFSLNFASPSLGLPQGTDSYAFEAAIFDLIGKTWGVPVYQLLGGKYQDKVAVSYWTAQWDGPGMEKIARRCAEMGYKSLKCKGRPGDPILDEFRAINKYAPDVKIICDFNQSLKDPKDPEEFIKLAKQLEGFNIQAIEDPFPFDIDVYKKVREKINIPIALHAGINPSNIIKVINAGVCDCFNLVGPMSYFVKNCIVANAGGMKAWHGSSVEVGVTDASFIHAIAATPNCTIGSDVLGYLIRKDDLLSKTFTVKDGFATVPDDPGLGVELDEDAIKRYSV